jgi:uncharacterized protein with HEPN domain
MAYRDRKPSAEELLLDIIEWSERLAGHVQGATAEGFLRDARLQDAVCRCLEVIGEAAGRLRALDPGLQQRHPDLDLARAYGARNWIAHGYAVVDYAIVWNAATDSVPKMAAAARALLQSGS